MKQNEVGVIGNISGYPSSKEFFSPCKRFPEYPFEEISETPNYIYSSLRDLFHLMGLDESNYGKSGWNPLGEIISPGNKVLIKPNLVYHQNSESDDVDSLLTHASIIRAICDYVIIASKGDCEITVADAPIQSADFEKILQLTGLERLKSFFQKRGIKFSVKDLRLEKTRISAFNKPITISKSLEFKDSHTLVDLGKRSLHDQYDIESMKKFRVTCYDPKTMACHHSKGVHRYIISKEILTSDCVINVPKLKTHRKAGITCSLKNLVGINGHKDCLPHHRYGSLVEKGDAFLEKNLFKKLTELFLDKRNSSEYPLVSVFFGFLAFSSFQLSKLTRKDSYFEGSWWGNDTLWRTILDLNRLFFYCDQNGRVTKERNNKKYLIIVDAVMCGEGEGPLAPRAKKLGSIVMGTNPVAVDKVCASMMGFDFLKIPSIRNAFLLEDLPIVSFLPSKIKIKTQKADLEQRADKDMFVPPKGWAGYIEE